MIKLVMVCYGQSQVNLDNCFMGWSDVLLMVKGIVQGKEVGVELVVCEFIFIDVYMFYMKWVIMIVDYILEVLDQLYLLIYKMWWLNECYYGVLSGFNKEVVK